MFASIAKFEFNYFRKQPSFIVVAAIFFLLSFFAMITEDVQIGVSGANINYNSPQAITQTMTIMSIIGLFLVANFVGGTATRDYVHKMNGIVHSLPISKSSYLWGRLLGSFAFCILVYLTVPLGTFFGSLWPSVDADRLGDTQFFPYFWALLVFVIPNFLFCSALFYSFAMKTRSIMGMYLGVLGFFILYGVSGQLLNDPSMVNLAALLDPFGLSAFAETTKNWTPHEMNTQVVSFTGLIMQNRFLWLAVSVVIMLITHFSIDIRKISKVKALKKETADSASRHREILKVTPSHSSSSQWLRFKTRTWFEIAQVIKSPAFIILALFTAFNLTGLFIGSSGSFGTDDWPLSRNMAEFIRGAFSLTILIITTYYAAESIWREKQLGVGDIIESTASNNWTLFFPKVIALILIMVSITAIGVAVTVMYQLSKSYTDIEWGVYALILFLRLLAPVIMVCVLAVFIQILSPNKYMGMLIFVIYIILRQVLSNLGLEHNLWHFSRVPDTIFSDMNSYGHFLKPTILYLFYWLGLSIILTVLGYGLYRRGTEYGLKHRLSLFKNSLGIGSIISLLLGATLFIGFGSYIYYNTRVINNFASSESQFDLQANYEKSYKQYQQLIIPKITDVNVNVDIYPKLRKVAANGYYLIQNKSESVIEKTLIGWDINSNTEINMDGSNITDFDDNYNIGWLHFNPALQPGEQRKLSYTTVRAAKGFVDKDADNTIVANGSFINNGTLLPHFGYNSSYELSDRQERKKRDLPPPQRLPKLEDKSQYRVNFIGPEADYINFETIVSTSIDQFAISPGYLQKEWTENGRKYYHYKMDAPIFNFVAFLSGRYKLAKETYKGISIEVYHHPTHDKNVQRMIESVKKSLDYYNQEFSPYQHRQVRIIEFPRYARFAQSFSNTIPYSEDIGFIADLRDEDAIDYVSFVTAHEMGHQWWGHQVMPANVQGSAVPSESLSEYSAYMVMEKLLGEHHLRKFLKFEMNRYLTGRSQEALEELPLFRAEGQTYIHYAKGGMVMYAMKDRLGEATFNKALRNFLEEFQYKSDPYPTTLDLIRHIKAQASEADFAFIDDLFTKITLFDFKTTKATAKKLDNGHYLVELEFEAEKFYADGQGEETKALLDERFDVGVFSMDPDDANAKDHVLIFQKERIKSGKNTFSFEVEKLPKYAGLDPYIKMIDRNSDDNMIEIELIEE